MESVQLVVANINDDRRGYAKYNEFCSNLYLKQRMPKIVKQINNKLEKDLLLGFVKYKMIMQILLSNWSILLITLSANTITINFRICLLFLSRSVCSNEYLEQRIN